MDTERQERFSDWVPLRQLCQSGNLSRARPFYAGSDVETRTARVRNAVNYIRLNWSQYPEFMRALQNLVEREAQGSGGGVASRMADLFSSVKDWVDERFVPGQDDYSAVRLYTSKDGYDQIFGVLNLSLRTDEFGYRETDLRAGVFLIELLNIDLYNYRVRCPEADGFVGEVYRGMSVSTEELRGFAAAASGPLEERYIAIPFAMASTTACQGKAFDFIGTTLGEHPHNCPVLWRIKVIALPSDLLGMYKSAFPTSVVSSIGAVPIQQLSDYPAEDEVLLRGPFFQLVRWHQSSRSIRGRPLHVLDAVTVQANRDHISNIRLSRCDMNRARDLMRILVRLHLAEVCAEESATYGLREAEGGYRHLALEQRRLLELESWRNGSSSD